ncbi:TIGR03364 family FAD-dependent oxidoreductase [Segnochrobactrum spirostomi]|uniref:TIGR03364 family FAD-dependent oxidoreductase n=1 Tax=Segnochrobactrum spirostomi TaxID=2608987 RepID=A0A6A7Y2Q9_9HYPH|nr:TIGR03364 family FAD-dependent oxidoreductase [Segnochrobactrum spirostomi]MQT12568.1 TIGR03364 family FAD-dependent oxidoreductase [Segnochrobactrum spirostomi]
MARHYDLAVVGAGIVGLGVALAAARSGRRVVVVDRSPKAVGASVRNFGFVTVTGQKAGDHWARARRSRDIWAEIAPEAGIPVLHAGLVLPAYRPEAAAVIEAFLATEMGAECRAITKAEALALVPCLRTAGLSAVLESPHELRVESREALPKLAAYLAERHGVDFAWNTAATGLAEDGIETAAGRIFAEAVAVCPGDDFTTLLPERIAGHGLRVCTLQMLRVQPAAPVRLAAAVMSDHSLARYEGFAHLAPAAALAARLDAEAGDMREAGVHLIAVQSADGSLVVGDSHVYGAAAEPFAEARIDDLILGALDDVLDLPGRCVIERWTGSYAASSERTVLVERPADHVRLVMVTGGTGASTAFALGEQVVEDLFGSGQQRVFQ